MTHLAKLSPEYCSGDDDDDLASRHTCRFTLEMDWHWYQMIDYSQAVRLSIHLGIDPSRQETLLLENSSCMRKT